MNVSVSTFFPKKDSIPSFVLIPFVSDNTFLPIDYPAIPQAYLSLLPSGSMRFRWNVQNLNRDSFFSQHLPSKDHKLFSMELIHSKKVFSIRKNTTFTLKQGDGFITNDTQVVPVITAADCMPIYLYNPKNFCFGVLHSGWKGTGIIREALYLAERKFGGKKEDFLVILGPHIHSCCYTVDQKRANYFIKNFGSSCITTDKNGRYHLSLAQANLSVLNTEGVKKENILHCTDCTCCATFAQKPYLGSFRRETAAMEKDADMEQRSTFFTPMAAFISLKQTNINST